MRFSLVTIIEVLASGIAATALPGLEGNKNGFSLQIFG
jgi:hypothetical protein